MLSTIWLMRLDQRVETDAHASFDEPLNDLSMREKTA
jgi:hypothetical protein